MLSLSKKFEIIVYSVIFSLIFVSCAQLKSSEIEPKVVIDVFIANNLEAENSRPMTKEDYGFAPLGDEGIRFFIPSLCPKCGGRVILYEDKNYLEKSKLYYETLGKESAALFSWVFIKDNILVQINGDLPEIQALKYRDALNSISQ